MPDRVHVRERFLSANAGLCDLPRIAMVFIADSADLAEQRCNAVQALADLAQDLAHSLLLLLDSREELLRLRELRALEIGGVRELGGFLGPLELRELFL